MPHVENILKFVSHGIYSITYKKLHKSIERFFGNYFVEKNKNYSKKPFVAKSIIIDTFQNIYGAVQANLSTIILFKLIFNL